jgi:uncharacterized protein YjbI with pentapeptide repeats
MALLVLFVVGVRAEEPDKDCPNPKGFRPAAEELAAILEAHREWVRARPSGSRAILCRADFQGADLKDVDLDGANLQEARLLHANLRRANLHRADLRGADLRSADLQSADLRNANMEGVNLLRADLKGANLHRANLKGAFLVFAELQGARLIGTDLQKANLREVQLQGANLFGANLRGSDLRDANLTGADLADANLSEAIFARVTLRKAKFEPISVPVKGSLGGISGLKEVSFREGKQSGVVLLRTALKQAGLRRLEREATYVIERLKTQYAPWPERYFKRVFFEWTCGYGLYPVRPLLILVGLLGLCTIVYTIPISMIPTSVGSQAAIVRLWPKGRVEMCQQTVEVAKTERAEQLYAKGLAVLGYAFHFSLLSAFHIGWRELNIGNWISRVQPRQYVLRATGWVRIVAGLQSVISVYLIALWVLTYFGRPFE